MKTFQQLLKELRACEEAIEWAGNMTFENVVKKCHRGDWLLWLAKEINVDDRKLTLAKGLCANTVRHLMKDERSIAAVDAAIAYGRGEIDRDELDASYVAAAARAARAATAAYAATDATDTTAYAARAAYAAYAATDTTRAAAYAAYAATDATAYAATAAYAAYAATAARAATAADAVSARKENQMQTANICREVIGQEIIEKVNRLLM